MADEDTKSPAVVSLEQEQARQQSNAGKADLTKALEDTFPASDPVSMTAPRRPTGRMSAEDAEHVRLNPDPADAVSKASEDATTFAGDLRKLVKDSPWTSVGVVVAVGYIWGLRH